MVDAFKLAVSHIAWQEEEEQAALALLKKYGFQGLEIAPPRVAGKTPYELPQKAREYAQYVQREFGLQLCSMQSIWFGKTGSMFGPEREALLAYSMQAIHFAKEAGIPNLVFGCPKNRVMPEGVAQDDAASFFKHLGDEAFKVGTCFSLEANPALYGTNFMNHTEEALDMAKRVNSPGCKVNFDMGTVVANGETLHSLQGRVAEIQHVHISEPELRAIERREVHKELAGILREEAYEGFVSVEMKSQPLPKLEETLAYMREIFI